jgi:hypothetical protein
MKPLASNLTTTSLTDGIRADLTGMFIDLHALTDRFW